MLIVLKTYLWHWAVNWDVFDDGAVNWNMFYDFDWVWLRNVLNNFDWVGLYNGQSICINSIESIVLHILEFIFKNCLSLIDCSDSEEHKLLTILNLLNSKLCNEYYSRFCSCKHTCGTGRSTGTCWITVR